MDSRNSTQLDNTFIPYARMEEILTRETENPIFKKNFNEITAQAEQIAAADEASFFDQIISKVIQRKRSELEATIRENRHYEKEKTEFQKALADFAAKEEAKQEKISQ